MAETTWPCSACGKPLDAHARFCPHCGHVVEQRADKPNLARTMMGVSPDVPRPLAPERAPRPPVAGPTGTTMGAAASHAAVSAAQAKAASERPELAKTMMGQGAPPPSAPSQPEAGAGSTPGTFDKGRTMLGTPGPIDARAIANAAAEARAKASAGAHGRTMLGNPELQSAAAAAGKGAAAPSTGVDSVWDRESELSVAPRPRSLMPLVIGVLCSLGLLAGALYLWKRPRTVEGLSVSVENIDGGEAMKFKLLDAEPGTKVEFGKQTVEIKGGEALFPLSVDSLEVGENVVVARVIEPDGDSETLRVPLQVDYRMRVDTAALHNDAEPAIEVIVAATPGTQVTLNGEALALDDQGRGMRRYTVDVAGSGRTSNLDHVIKYRIVPPKGEAVVGELHTHVPITTVQLDSPGPVAITDAASIEFAGAVPKGTTVSIDGVKVEVNDAGRFLYVYPLPQPGTFRPTLLAKTKDRAPRALSVELTRVADLAKAAAAYAPERKLAYAEIAQNPSIYKGQRVDFEGRVFNVKTSHGLGVLQMLVKDCAKGRQCSLWVTYPATTAIANDSWVRVLGTVDGEQQFRSKRDEVVSVPKVQALFVLAE